MHPDNKEIAEWLMAFVSAKFDEWRELSDRGAVYTTEDFNWCPKQIDWLYNVCGMSFDYGLGEFFEVKHDELSNVD